MKRKEEEAQAAGENRYAARFVDEVDGPAIEGELLVVGLAATGQEYHRQVDAGAPQSGQQIDA